jgi:tRNA G18 (ribose-2'-O)-methylase SpoU
MRVLRVDRFDDPRIDDYRNVSDAELLRQRDLFVIEGRLGIERLLASGSPVVSLLLNDASFRALEGSLSAVPDDVPVYLIGTGDFGLVTGFNLHRGCLAMAPRPPEHLAADIVDSAELILVLEAVSDASNVGAAFRNAAAFGAGAVLLSPTCCDPLYRKAIRTSMGSVLTVPFARLPQWPADLDMLKTRGFTVVALTPRDSAIDLDAYAKQRAGARLALLVGTEGAGLTAEAEAKADVCVRISIRADVDSLNLATAAGIALHCLRP